MKHSFWKHIFLPYILLSFTIIMVLGLIFAAFSIRGSSFWPSWAMWLVPIFVSVAGIWFLRDRYLKGLYLGRRLFSQVYAVDIYLYLSLGLISVFIFIPMMKSIRYNLAEVVRLESVNDIKPYESFDFIELDDWHVDRMRVIPFSYFELAGGSNLGKVELNTLFVVPLFSKKDPYLTTAKAWMGFKYTDYVSIIDAIGGSEREVGEHLRRSYNHFKMRDISDFAYLEALPKNKVRRMFQALAATHSYYNSKYDNVYMGQEVERDILSLYYLKFMLFVYVTLGLPIALLFCWLIYRIQKKNELHELANL